VKRAGHLRMCGETSDKPSVQSDWGTANLGRIHDSWLEMDKTNLPVGSRLVKTAKTV
jgi:hypothetical protein